MPRMTGGEAIVQSLLTNGVRTLFALPTVIEVPVGEMPSPWHLILRGNARGD